MAEYTHLSTPDPELQAFSAQLAAQHPPPTDIHTLRKSDRALALEVSLPQSMLKVQDWKVPVQDGEITVRSYIPQENGGKGKPLLVWAHGGGWSIGGLFTDHAMLQTLAIDLQISIVNVDYRLAPEHPFPTGLNDTYDALKWAHQKSGQLGADPTKGFILGGCSAGGNMTAVLTHRARDDPYFAGKLTGQLLQVPMVVHKDAVPVKYQDQILSLEQNKDAPILSIKAMEFFLNNYGCRNPSDPNLSPIYWRSHKDLPPAILQVCGMDPLRDEAFLYEKLLKEEGVKTKLYAYPGVPHGFEVHTPGLTQVARWHEDMRDGLRWLLRG